MRHLLNSFISRMNLAGLEPAEPIIGDSTLHRFNVLGDRKNSRNGWYILYPDYPTIGIFGCWKRQIKVRWQPNTPPYPPMRVVRLLHERQQAIDRQIKACFPNQFEALQRLQRIWDTSPMAHDRHGYLMKKQVHSHGLRYHDRTVLIPVTDSSWQIHGLQRIWPDGTKRFVKGTVVSGNFFMFGEPTETILLCEGYSTGATLYECTGQATVISFDCGNLRWAAESIRKSWPSQNLIICADDDHATPGNPGLTSAQEAARLTGAAVVRPIFLKARGNIDTDFNDLCRMCGPEAVCRSLEVTYV